MKGVIRGKGIQWEEHVGARGKTVTEGWGIRWEEGVSERSRVDKKGEKETEGMCGLTERGELNYHTLSL